MDLVGGHRRRVRVAGRALGHPGVVRPREGRRIPHARGSLGANLHREGQRIGLEPQRPIPAEDLVLVELADTDAGHEELPDAAGAHRAHRHQTAVPAIEVADDPHAPRVWRPDGEAHAGRALVRADMRAEHVVQVLVGALADQVQVDLAEGRAEPIRVVELPGVAVGKAEPDPIRELPRPQLRHEPAPQAVRPSGSIGSTPPFGATSQAALASGWKARTTVPSAAGCAPRIACGFVVLAARQAANFLARGRGVDRRHRPNHTRPVGRLPRPSARPALRTGSLPSRGRGCGLAAAGSASAHPESMPRCPAR